ncbi:MAG: histidine phosphatase family protein [Chthoniobacterales bacterium]
MTRFILSLSALVCFAASAPAGLKVYYLRHAQSGANVEHEWEFMPKIFRPSYVGNADTFSPHGKKQAAAIPDKLAGYKFDFIAVSPTWRTRQTILGFLQKNHRRGEIWPELEEFGIDAPRAHELLASNNAPKARQDLFSGSPVKLSDDEKNNFTLRENAKKRFNLRDDRDERIADCVKSLNVAIDLIKQRGVRGDNSILLVGHATSGALLLHMLVKNEGELPPIKNAHLWMAEQQPDGRFVLKVYNDDPVGMR